MNVENLAMQKNDQYFTKALTHGSCPLRLRSYSLALDRTDFIRQSGFRRRIVFDWNTLKENTANCVGFFQVLPQKTTFFESALCMPSPIVRILISMPIPMYSFFPYVHKYVLGLHIYNRNKQFNLGTRKDVHPNSDVTVDA